LCVTVVQYFLLQLWEYLLIDRFGSKSCYEMHWKNFRMVKKVLEDKLVGQKRHLRALLIDRTVLQHESLLERGSVCLTPTHRQIMLNLLTLSTSHYSEVSLLRVCWSKASSLQGRDSVSKYLSCCRCVLGPRRSSSQRSTSSLTRTQCWSLICLSTCSRIRTSSMSSSR
jgi:hypothetical protein